MGKQFFFILISFAFFFISCSKESSQSNGGTSINYSSFEGKYLFTRGLPSTKLDYSKYNEVWNYFQTVPNNELYDYIYSINKEPGIIEFTKEGKLYIDNALSCYFKYDSINKTLITCSDIDCINIPQGVAPIYNYLPNKKFTSMNISSYILYCFLLLNVMW